MDVLLLIEAENTIDRACEEQGSLKANRSKKNTQNQKETVEIFGTHNEERGLGVFDTQKTGKKEIIKNLPNDLV